MSAVTVEPLFPDIVLHLTEGRQDPLSLIDRTTAALERAGETEAVAAFGKMTELISDDYQDLITLIRVTVTVI
jgi:hypothetical protein